MTTKAAIYVRQSTTSEGTISPALQRRNCEAFVQRQGWQLVSKSYEDIDISGKKTANRPGYLSLRADYENGDFNVVVADDWSRFARNEVEGLAMLGSMQLASASQGVYDEDTNHLPTAIQFIIDADFSRKMGKRWRNALVYRLERGLPPSGKPQFGYDKQGKDAYIPNADAAIVREAYARYTAGEGSRAICEDFTARGLASAGPAGWYPNGLFDLLDKTFYAGFITYEGQDFPGAHEPLLTPAQWAAYRKARETRKTHARPRNTKWMLQGLVVCGLCGSKMLSHMARGVPSLACSTYNAQGKAGCPGTFRKREIVMKKFRFWLHKHQQEWADAMPSDDEAKTAAETAVADAQTAHDSTVEDYSRYQQWAYENRIVPAVSAKTLAEKAEAITAAQAVLDEAQAALGEFVPASTVRERINAGIKVLGLDVPENDPSLEEEPTEAEAAIMREIYAKMIDRIVVLPPSHPSPRHPDRDLMAEIEVHPKEFLK